MFAEKRMIEIVVKGKLTRQIRFLGNTSDSLEVVFVILKQDQSS